MYEGNGNQSGGAQVKERAAGVVFPLNCVEI